MKEYNNNIDILSLLFKWKYHILIITIIGIILASIFSSPSFITPKYKSKAVVYPSNISSYSDESETEQMLQILQSRDIKDSVIKMFNLPEHYELDSNYKYFYTILYYEYSKNVKISKTSYESVEISVLDKDPIIACDMVNAIIYFYNKKVRILHNDKYREVVKMYKNILAFKKASIDSLEAELHKLSTEYGLIDFESQVIEITKGHLKTIMGTDRLNVNEDEVKRLRENMENKGGELITLVESIRQEARTYADFKLEYEDAVRFYTDVLTYANIITPPFPSDKKSYPVRWLIVLFTALSTFVLTVIIILIINKYKTQIKSQLKHNQVSNK